MSTEREATAPANTIIEVLIDGLRLSDRSLNGKCSAALCDIGQPAILHLMPLLQGDQIRPAHRKRLLDVVDRIRHGLRSGAGLSQSVLCALLDAVRSDDPRLISKVRVAFGFLHPEVTDRLILEAVCARSRTRYCMRLLDLVGELDHQPGFRGLANLGFLALAKREEISQRAAELIVQFGPHRERCGFPPRPAARQIQEPVAEPNQLSGAVV